MENSTRINFNEGISGRKCKKNKGKKMTRIYLERYRRLEKKV